MQKSWATREKELEEKAECLRTDATFVNVALAETARLREEAKAAKQEAEIAKTTAVEAVKEAKLIKEELRTCRVGKDYHVDLANQKTSLNSNLQNDLQA